MLLRCDVQAEKAVEFESSLVASQASSSGSGSMASFIMRRDATKADDGCNYIVTSIWKSKEEYAAWKKENNESAAHAIMTSKDFFYEGVLALSSNKGI